MKRDTDAELRNQPKEIEEIIYVPQMERPRSSDKQDPPSDGKL